MEEEHHHNHQHYGGGGSSNSTPAMADLRQFFSPIPTHHHHHHQFPPQPPTLYSAAAVTAFPHHYDAMMLVMGAGGQDFRGDNSAGVTAAMVPSSSAGGGFDMENAAGGGFGLGVGGGDGGATARWPRQETLTLLEIRSRLDHKFKEANHKGPLWDEVSRIMCEEHGYQRSGKKCREKFENLYKYYKKTKEGKAGRQDGKHYRFFRQLEALYGDTTHYNPVIISNHATTTTTAAATTATALEFHSSMNRSISVSNNDTSSDFSTSSSEEEDGVERVGSMDSSMAGRRSRKRRGTGRSWKAKIKEFIESQMRKVMEKQEAWLEKMMSGLEHREKERIMREEEWRKQEVMRMEREHRFWARERAWIEARDKALMDALQRITGKDVGSLTTRDHDHHDHQRWEESEMMKLVELRASVEERFDECGGGPGESGLWEEISSRMACLGHDRSAKMCKEKWEFISKELGKKRSHQHHRHNHQYQHQEHHPQTTNLLYNYGTHEMNGQVLGPPPPPNPMNDSCLRILLGDGGGGGETNPWESYGVKLINKGDQTH